MRKSSALARRQQRNHARYRGRNDLTIVPMLDVMVILTFFLIFTAVFSKTSVLEVNLPGPGTQAATDTPRFELELILRKSGIEVADRNQGVLETIPAVASGQDVTQLTDYLAALKVKVPDVTPRDAAGRRGRGLRHDRAGDGRCTRAADGRGRQGVARVAVPADRTGRRSDMIRTGMRRHSRRGKGGGGGHGPLALIPMIDMLTILVVYLLVHAADMDILPNSKNITHPAVALGPEAA